MQPDRRRHRPQVPSLAPRLATLGPGVGSVRPREDLLPGLLLVASGATVAWGAAAVVGPLSVLVGAVIVGVAIGNVGLATQQTQPGLTFAARRLLRVGVVLLGLRLSVADIGALGSGVIGTVAATVTVTFFGTQWLGRRLGLTRQLSLLVATGYSICGASAIVAVEGATGAEEEEVATAVGLVALFGTLAVFALPPIGALLGLTPVEFGTWVGASVHDVAQVVATAGTSGPDALAIATIVKLTRVVLLAPLVTGISLHSRRASSGAGVNTGPTFVPLFVAGFLTMIAMRSTSVLPTWALDAAALTEKVVLAAALVGLGAGVRLTRLRQLGPQPLVLGALAWVLVASVAYLCIAPAG